MKNLSFSISSICLSDSALRSSNVTYTRYHSIAYIHNTVPITSKYNGAHIHELAVWITCGHRTVAPAMALRSRFRRDVSSPHASVIGWWPHTLHVGDIDYTIHTTCSPAMYAYMESMIHASTHDIGVYFSLHGVRRGFFFLNINRPVCCRHGDIYKMQAGMLEGRGHGTC